VGEGRRKGKKKERETRKRKANIPVTHLKALHSNLIFYTLMLCYNFLPCSTVFKTGTGKKERKERKGRKKGEGGEEG